MAPWSAYLAGGEVRIQVSVPVEMATIVGLTVHIITDSPLVSIVLLVVVIYSVDVFLVCLYYDLFDCERSMHIEDC